MQTDFNQRGFWAVVLGGSSGLGLASALKLARHGMNICIIHRNSRSEMELIEQDFEQIRGLNVRFLSFNLDASNPEKRSQTISELKKELSQEKVRCLIHSISKGNLKAMVGEEQSLRNDDFSITLQHMALSLYDWVKELFEEGLFASDARVLSFTSEGNRKAIRNYGAVSTAKVALEAISRNIALEFAPYGIRANCIQAGITDTRSLRMIPGNEKMKEQALERNPFHRLTTPEDVANVVYLLCRDEAAWINGAIIPVDGGEIIC